MSHHMRNSQVIFNGIIQDELISNIAWFIMWTMKQELFEWFLCGHIMSNK